MMPIDDIFKEERWEVDWSSGSEDNVVFAESFPIDRLPLRRWSKEREMDKVNEKYKLMLTGKWCWERK